MPTADSHTAPGDWYTQEFQRAVDKLADPNYRDMKIQIAGPAGCGFHEATSDVAELEKYAREIGPDASFALVTGAGNFPVPLGPPSGNGDGKADAPPVTPAGDLEKSLSYRPLSTIKPAEIAWSWPNRVANGKCNLFYGDGGVGKSFVLVDMMARLSTGTPWPDCQDTPNAPGTVILLNAEDDPNDTIRVRFDSQGGDPTKVYFVDGVKRSKDGNDCGISLAHDLDVIEQLAMETRARLLIVDPVTAYTGGKDIYKDDQVRDITTPLKSMAERLKMAVVLVMHTNKTATINAKYKAANAAAWINSCRMAWMFAEDPNDPRRRTMTNAKNNLVYSASGLSFSFDEAEGCLKWDAEPLEKTADQVLQELAENNKAAPRREAEAWLKAALAEGSVDASEILALAKGDDIAEKTLRRAKKALKIKSAQDGYGGGHRWSMPAGGH